MFIHLTILKAFQPTFMPHMSTQHGAVLNRDNFILLVLPYVIRNFYFHGSEIFFRSCKSGSQILPAFMDP